MSPAPPFRLARAADAPAIAALVNAAYRGSRAGWTTEADLLEGDRIGADGVAGLLAGPGSVILLWEGQAGLLGSVHLQRGEEDAYLGLFVVQPDLQNGGLGKRLLAEAEAFVRQAWGTRRVRMTVLTARAELLAYYERRGYRRTGRRMPFPAEAGAGTPKAAGLELETLEKDLA